MCTDCGCGDTAIVPVDVHERILAGNDRVAGHNREHFAAAGVLAVNLMGSPTPARRPCSRRPRAPRAAAGAWAR